MVDFKVVTLIIIKIQKKKKPKEIKKNKQTNKIVLYFLLKASIGVKKSFKNMICSFSIQYNSQITDYY